MEFPYEVTHDVEIDPRFLMPAAEHTARQLEIFVEAACHYGLVLELLSVIHEMRNGRQLDAEDAQLVNTASIAALLAKVERSNRGIDSE